MTATRPYPAFEDFVPGEVTTFGAYEVTKDEVIDFASQFDPQPFHLDEEAGRASMLGGLAASGWHSCAILMRMMFDGFMNGSTSIGSPGIDEVRWLKPVFPATCCRSAARSSMRGPRPPSRTAASSASASS